MKFRTSVATALVATAVVAVGAAPANASTAAAKPAPLTLRAGAATAHYGQWVELTAHLGATAGNNRTVEIDNGSSVVKKGRVDAHGDLTAWFKAAHNATFVATFAGDPRDKAATARVRVTTTALVGAHFVNGSVVGGYTVYHVGQGRHPQLVIAVAPDKTGEHVTAHVQAWSGSSWADVKLPDPVAALQTGSSVVLTYDKLPAGVTFREYVSYGGDATNVGSSTGWNYAKTVN